ncbi:hypothetical protein N7488_001798 [Penicillium malachiteum]|nr:hypothetical protein N7488_001798 [Penicillium malachiteum]
MLGGFLLAVCFIAPILASYLPLEFHLRPRKVCLSADIISNLTAIGEHTKKWNTALKATHDGRAEAKIIITQGKAHLALVKAARQGECTDPTDNQRGICQAIKTYLTPLQFIGLEEETLKTIKSMNNTVVGTSKHSFSSILEYDEDAINNYLFGLVGAVPDCLHEVGPLVDSLVASLKTTVEAYGEYS